MSDHLNIIKNRYDSSKNDQIESNLNSPKLDSRIFNKLDFEGKKVLEIGGGFSLYVDLFFELGASEVYANDLIENRFLSKYDNDKRYKKIVGDFLNVEIEEKVDVVFAKLTLMFLVPFHDQIFKKINKILNNDGIVIFFEPNYLSPLSIIRRFTDFKPNPARLFSPFSISKRLKDNNYKIEFFQPIMRGKKFPWLIATNFWIRARKKA
jgi:SAM-dependent methyltransferase